MGVLSEDVSVLEEIVPHEGMVALRVISWKPCEFENKQIVILLSGITSTSTTVLSGSNSFVNEKHDHTAFSHNNKYDIKITLWDGRVNIL